MIPSRPSIERTFVALAVIAVLTPLVTHVLSRSLVGPSFAVTVALAGAPLAPLVAVALARGSARTARFAAVLGTVAALASALASGAPWGILAPIVAAGILAGAGLPWVAARLSASFDGALGTSRRAAVWFALAATLAAVQTARLSAFMEDPSLEKASAIPTSTFLIHHSCMSAYVNAAEWGRRGVSNVYDKTINGPDATDAASALPIRPLVLDAYEYPPPFLILPRLALFFTSDFFAIRTAWFVIDALGLLAAMAVVARFIGGRDGTYVALLAPATWLALPLLVGLQEGNFQLAMIALAMTSMVAFERERPLLGGALLGFAIVAKISPGILLVYLLMRKRWKDVAFTAGACAAYTALGLLVLGPGVFGAFASYQLPRLATGEAFSFMTRDAFTIGMNSSIFGLPFKLHALGLPTTSWALSSRLAWAYTAVVVGLAVVAAKRDRDPRERAASWLALVSLGALRSPFGPPYVLVSTIWMLALIAPEWRGRGKTALIAMWVALSIVPPPTLPLKVFIGVTLAWQLLAIALPAWVVARGRNRPAVA
jgi:hypothetical protein